MTERELENYKLKQPGQSDERLDWQLSKILHDAACEKFGIDPKTIDSGESNDLTRMCDDIVATMLEDWETQVEYWNDERDSKKTEETMGKIDAQLKKGE